MEKSPKRKKSSPIGKNLAAAIAAVPLTDAQAKCFKIGTKTEVRLCLYSVECVIPVVTCGCCKVFEEGAWHPAIVTEHVSGQGALLCILVLQQFLTSRHPGAHGVRKLNYQVAKWKGWTLRIGERCCQSSAHLILIMFATRFGR